MRTEVLWEPVRRTAMTGHSSVRLTEDVHVSAHGDAFERLFTATD